MSKLYFRYGVVSSAKTLNLLATLHNYESQGKYAILLKPLLDTRTVNVESRAGLSHKPDLLVNIDTEIGKSIDGLFGNASAILVDEVQFLTSSQIKDLRHISLFHDIPVICYGLRTKSDGELWESIITLMAIADSIEEIKTTCFYCNKKAIFSKAIDNNNELGDIINPTWDGYIPVCANHYYGIS